MKASEYHIGSICAGGRIRCKAPNLRLVDFYLSANPPPYTGPIGSLHEDLRAPEQAKRDMATCEAAGRKSKPSINPKHSDVS